MIRSASENPPENALGPNVDESNLLDAIEESGYPLQGRCAGLLEAHFRITEEWGFLDDSDSPVPRSLDIFGWRALSQGPEVSCFLATLIECKRSSLPYVFFKDVTPRAIPNFPRLAGGYGRTVDVHLDGSNQLKRFDTTGAFGLSDHPFMHDGPAHCSSFSRADPKSGGAFRFSGSEPYNRVVQPLLRAVDHSVRMFKDNGKKESIQLHLLAAIAVIDAPMLLVSDPEAPRDAVLTPWIRVVRHEARTERHIGSRWYGIDFVHVSYLRTFVVDHLMPYAEALGKACSENLTLLRDGGLVDDLENFMWNEVRPKQG